MGDLIKLGIGDIVPADVQLLSVVVNTGSHTRFSNVVSLAAKAQLEERSDFQKMDIQIGNFLILIAHHFMAQPSGFLHRDKITPNR